MKLCADWLKQCINFWQDLASISKCLQYVPRGVPSILVGEDADDGEGGEEAGEDFGLCDGLCSARLGFGVSAASLEPEDPRRKTNGVPAIKTYRP